jgi:hypothetical protein
MLVNLGKGEEAFEDKRKEPALASASERRCRDELSPKLRRNRVPVTIALKHP